MADQDSNTYDDPPESHTEYCCLCGRSFDGRERTWPFCRQTCRDRARADQTRDRALDDRTYRG